MDNDALVTIASTGATPTALRNYEVRVFGSQAVILLELWRGTLSIVDFGDRRTDYPNLAPEEVYPHLAPAANLVDSVIDPARNLSPGILGLASMNVVEAACVSAREDGRWVSVSELR
jgi:hypothetical protein